MRTETQIANDISAVLMQQAALRQRATALEKEYAQAVHKYNIGDLLKDKVGTWRVTAWYGRINRSPYEYDKPINISVVYDLERVQKRPSDGRRGATRTWERESELDRMERLETRHV